MELDATQRRALRKRWRRAPRRGAEPQRHYNFTDPESRLMRDHGLRTYGQGYNAQRAVDSEAQVILAAEVTQDVTDHYQLLPRVEQVRVMMGESPACVTADAGDWHTAHLVDTRLTGINGLVPPDSKHKKNRPRGNELAHAMRQKLAPAPNRVLYATRQTTVEPGIAPIKEGRGFRRFRFRGGSRVHAQWRRICLTHNLLKLFRLRWRPALQPVAHT